MKQCSNKNCKQINPQSLENFNNDKSRKDGKYHQCRNCQKDYFKLQPKRNRTQERKQRYIDNREKELLQCKEYRDKHNTELDKRNRNEYQKQWRLNNPDKKYSQPYKERAEYFCKYGRKRIKNDSNYRLYSNVARYIRKNLLVSFVKIHNYTQYLGYTIEILKFHLENLFEPGMTWSNYGRGEGKWNIDHRIPRKYKENGVFYWDQIELGNLNSEVFRKFWSLNNLQPKWSISNIKKGANFKD